MDYENINEVAGPPPAQDSQGTPSEHQKSVDDQIPEKSEQRRTSTGQQTQDVNSDNAADEDAPDDYDNLDEVIGPPPDQNPQDRHWYQQDNLEERKPEEASRREKLQSRSHAQPKSKPLLTQLYTTSYLVLFAIMGTLSRLGVQWLTTYPNAPVIVSELWANVGGCFILGFLQEDRALFAPQNRSRFSHRKRHTQGDLSDHEQVASGAAGEDEKPIPPDNDRARKTTLPMYIGLSVGFCGSFTSFSSLIRDCFLALSNDLGSNGDIAQPRSAGWSVCALLAVLITEISLSLSALSLGAHFATLTSRVLAHVPNIQFQRFLDPLSVLLGFGCWLGAIFLAIWPPRNEWRGEVVFALVFAPPGCLLRFFLALKLNGLSGRFPFGTFTSNVLGTLVIATVYDLQHSKLGAAGIGRGVIGCQVFQGVEDGFSGCLTTVSTLVTELKGLRKHHAYIYGVVSVGVSLVSVIVIVGSVRWTIGLSSIACTV